MIFFMFSRKFSKVSATFIDVGKDFHIFGAITVKLLYPSRHANTFAANYEYTRCNNIKLLYIQEFKIRNFRTFLTPMSVYIEFYVKC